MKDSSNWTTEDSAELYGINFWGQPFFKINDSGNVEVTPKKDSEFKVDLYELTQELVERGMRAPLLIRFEDIVDTRIELLNNCFENAIKECNYQSKYTGVYPIKVNQEKHLVEDIIKIGKKHRLGLECGSKPELLITLALMDTEEAFIVCNGFKDPEYIETALLAQRIGKNIFIVVDRMEEIDFIIDAAKTLNIQPQIGFRGKLNTQGAGKWVESSGARSKFGLTPSEMMKALKKLEKAEMSDCLKLLHFHIGSQIPSIHSIKSTIKEGARMFTELHKLAPSISFIDVGGGLGIDYDGSGKSDSSTNYSEQEYANDVVSILQSVCDEKSVPHPHIISESGRALVAHSSILVFDVLGSNPMKTKALSFEISEKDSRLVKDLYELWTGVNKDNINEYYNDLIEKKRDILQLFTYGALSLEQRAKAEDLFWATSTKIAELTQNMPDFEDLYYELAKDLSDTYFGNFSVFQSLPDSWALDQLFPVLPIHRLQEKPDNTAIIVDLTCDSDGKISDFIDTQTGGTQKYLEVHNLKDTEAYYMGVFLTGAYQEILGDMHNLFGDTDTVYIRMKDGGYNIEHYVEGDTVTDVLSYVSYTKPELTEKIRQSIEKNINAGNLSKIEARLLMQHYELGLSGYTYFERI